MSDQTVGLRGEQAACNYLLQNGYHILDRNYRTKFGEIDIVASKNQIVGFFEVKTRTSNAKGKPYESVTPRKLQHLQKACTAYILQKKLQKAKLSLKVISVEMNSQQIVKQIREYTVL